MAKKDSKVVIFDLDDTLIPNARYYHQIKMYLFQLFTQIFKTNILEKEFLQALDKIDLKKSNKHGLNRARFPLSVIELYILFCKKYKKRIFFYEIDAVFVLANTVFEIVDKLSPEAIAMLKTLKSEGYILYLLTSGDEIVQTYKLVKSEIWNYINKKNTIIVPYKNKDIYTTLFKKYKMENCVMVGNSRKSDVNPALESGMSAIYLPCETWSYEDAVLKESEQLYTINSLEKIPETLKIIYK